MTRELFFKFSFIFDDNEGAGFTDNGVKGGTATDRARAYGILMWGRVGARGRAMLRLFTDDGDFRGRDFRVIFFIIDDDDSSRDTGGIPCRLRQTMARATRPFFMGNGVVTETVTFISFVAEKFHLSSCSVFNNDEGDRFTGSVIVARVVVALEDSEVGILCSQLG